MDVTSLCGGCEATQLHVLDKSLSERCHIGILQVGMWVTCDNPSPVCRKPRTRQCQELLLPPAIVPLSQPLTAKRFSSPEREITAAVVFKELRAVHLKVFEGWKLLALVASGTISGRPGGEAA
jgi:hypothetical protein